MIHNTIAQQMFEMIQNDFKFPLKDRLHIAPEVEMYRKGEDESVWKQAKTCEFSYQVFFDGEFICDFEASIDKQVAYLRFYKAFLEAYESERIYINPAMYEIENLKRKQEETAKEEAFKKQGERATTSEEKLVHEAVRQAKEESKPKGRKIKIATKST